MSSSLKQRNPLSSKDSPHASLLRRLVISLIALVWVVLAGVMIWLIGHVVDTVVLLSIAALVGYAAYPLVNFVERIMPRWLAIISVYLVVLSGLCILMYFTLISLVSQLNTLIPYFQELFQPGKPSPIQPLIDLLNSLGFTHEDLVGSIQQVIAQLQAVVNDIVPLLHSMFTLFFNMVLVTTLSIYFLLDGGKISHWLLNRTPLSQQERIAFLMKTVDRAVGGYIRGTIVINALVGLLVWVGVFLLRIPYSFLLAVLAFFLSFIPMVGGFIIVAVSLLFALPEGWLTMLLVAIFLILLQGVLIRQIIGPRVLGQAVGLHPIIAISALVAGGGLFGLLGALFALPIVGIVQACLQALWSAWKAAHPEEFPAEKEMT